jgi:hypothetical protein
MEVKIFPHGIRLLPTTDTEDSLFRLWRESNEGLFARLMSNGGGVDEPQWIEIMSNNPDEE